MLRKVLLVFLLVSITNAINNENYHHYYQNKIPNALHKLFDFVIREPDLNFDGLFGIVHSKALIKSMLNENHNTALLSGLYEKASIAAQKVFEKLPNESHKINIFKKYLLQENLWEKHINFTLGRLSYDTPKISTIDDLSDFLVSLKSNVTIEKISDFCIANLLEETKNDDSHICTVSDKCVDFINNESGAFYGMTHKLLYLQIARAKRCIFVDGWFDEKTRNFCSRILWEANQTRELKLDYYLFDLLVEQIYLCGYEGYAEFLRMDWLDQILFLQNSHGCYSSEGRRKRETNRIKYGCSDHTTGLVSAVLSLFYFYIVKNK